MRRPVLSVPKGLACLLPLLAATGCVHTGTFEAPVPVPAGRMLVSVGGMASGQHALDETAETLVLTSVEGRIDFSSGPVTVSMRGTPTSGGVGARVQMPTPFPLALIGGGGFALGVGDCGFIACAIGPSGYAGVSAGLPPHKGWVPYLSARLVASQVELKSCGGDETWSCDSRPATEPLFGVLSLGIAPQRGGLHVETGVSVQRTRRLYGEAHAWTVAPSMGLLARVLL